MAGPPAAAWVSKRDPGGADVVGVETADLVVADLADIGGAGAEIWRCRRWCWRPSRRTFRWPGPCRCRSPARGPRRSAPCRPWSCRDGRESASSVCTSTSKIALPIPRTSYFGAVIDASCYGDFEALRLSRSAPQQAQRRTPLGESATAHHCDAVVRPKSNSRDATSRRPRSARGSRMRFAVMPCFIAPMIRSFLRSPRERWPRGCSASCAMRRSRRCSARVPSPMPFWWRFRSSIWCDGC